MQTIARSGQYSTDDAQLVVVTQGISGNDLIAGKQILFRLFLTDASHQAAHAVVLNVVGPAGVGTFAAVVARSDLIEFTDGTGMAGLGVVLKGFAFPQSGKYSVSLTVIAVDASPLVMINLDDVRFAETRDLRILIVPLVKSLPNQNFLEQPGALDVIAQGMAGIASIMPLRDCVKNSLNGARLAGLRYHVGKSKEGWPLEVGLPDNVDYFDEENAINNAAGLNQDKIDATVVYRPSMPNQNEAGGIANYCGTPRHAHCVTGPFWGTDMAVPCIAQEMGHTFCLEPTGSPHYQDLANPLHSKDAQISDPFAFDFVNLCPRKPGPEGFIGDLMNNLGAGAWQGSDSVAYNAYDWNFLREQFVKLDSTGTESQPATHDPCAPSFKVPVSAALWQQLIGNLADGSLWVVTPHGLVPVPGPSPEHSSRFPYGALPIQKIARLLNSKGEPRAVYVSWPGMGCEVVASPHVATASLHSRKDHPNT